MAGETHDIGGSVLGVELFTSGLPESRWIIGSDAIEYLYLVEDLYALSITGKIRFYDRIGLMEFGPINGSEKFRITFGNSGGSGNYKTIIMDIQKIVKVEGYKGHQQSSDTIIELILVDEYYRSWHSNVWSKAWTNTTVGTVVTDISKEFCDVEFDSFEQPTEKIEHFDTHLRTPAENVKWLTDRSSGAVSGQPGYCLHRYNKKGEDTFVYRAVTLEQLLQQKKYMAPFGTGEDGTESTVATYYFDSTHQQYVNAIKDFEINLVDFSAINTLTGESYLGYDIQRKKLIQRDYNFKDALERYTVLGTKTLFPEYIEIQNPIKNIETLDSERFMDNLWYGRWIKEYCNQQLVKITVDGHEDRHVGGMIRIVWPSSRNYSQNTKDVAEKYNRQMDGKYLVKSITHFFSNDTDNGWAQKLTCIKNGYKDSVNTKLIGATKVNNT